MRAQGEGSWDSVVQLHPQPPLAPEASLCLKEQTALGGQSLSAGDVKSDRGLAGLPSSATMEREHSCRSEEHRCPSGWAPSMTHKKIGPSLNSSMPRKQSPHAPGTDPRHQPSPKGIGDLLNSHEDKTSTPLQMWPDSQPSLWPNLTTDSLRHRARFRPPRSCFPFMQSKRQLVPCHYPHLPTSEAGEPEQVSRSQNGPPVPTGSLAGGPPKGLQNPLSLLST